MNYLIRTCLYLTFCLAFCMSAGQLDGQVVYTVTGVANNLGLSDGRAPEVAADETYVAEFEIDLSVADTDPDPDRGVYSGAIVSSSIEFSGGYSSQVDFADGEIIVLRDSGGGGIGLSDPTGLGSILVFDIGNPFDSDALLDDPTTEFDGSPESLYVLMEPTGFIISFSEVAVGPPISFSISEIEPVLLGDVNLSGGVDFADIPPFISLLIAGQFQAEADLDQNGEVNFLDTPLLVSFFIGQ